MLSALILLIFTLSLLVWPRAVSGAAASSVAYCLHTLVPSLFPFMVLCGFAVESPAAARLSRPLGLPARYLFRLPGCCAAPIRPDCSRVMSPLDRSREAPFAPAG